MTVREKKTAAALECKRHLDDMQTNVHALFERWIAETDRDAADARAEIELRPTMDAIDVLLHGLKEGTISEVAAEETLRRYSGAIERMVRP